MKTLITGGGGFIGYHLAHDLVKEGREVVLVMRSRIGKNDPDFLSLVSHPLISIIEADLSVPEEWQKIGAGYDMIYHLLSINGMKQFDQIPNEVLRVGVGSMLGLLDWLRNTNMISSAKVVFTSSNEVYTGGFMVTGSLPNPTPETVPLVIPDPYTPRWTYAAQKIMGELLLIYYAQAYKLRVSIVRLHNIYGPRAGYHPLIPKLIGRIHACMDPFPLFGPDDIRSFCYVVDAVAAMQLVMMSRGTDTEIYNVGGSQEISIREIADELFRIHNWHPHDFDIQASPPDTLPINIPDISKIRADTGWIPATSYAEGLRKTVEWYKDNPQNTSRTN
ncbi:MAG: NAD(P)-dependent oxidoreductase [Minisyncoccia bacterium]